MAGELSIFINAKDRTLVSSFLNRQTVSLPAAIQGETLTLLVYFLNPVGLQVSSPFEYLDFSGGTLKVGICGGDGRPTGTASDPTPTVIAFQDTFSEIPNGFSGELTLNTPDVATFLGALSERASTFEVELTPAAGDPVKYLQIPVIIKAAVIESASTVPTPISSYMTRNESLAAFVKQIGLPGETVQFTSPNGLYGRILGVRDDGTRQDDVIEL